MATDSDQATLIAEALEARHMVKVRDLQQKVMDLQGELEEERQAHGSALALLNRAREERERCRRRAEQLETGLVELLRAVGKSSR